MTVDKRLLSLKSILWNLVELSPENISTHDIRKCFEIKWPRWDQLVELFISKLIIFVITIHLKSALELFVWLLTSTRRFLIMKTPIIHHEAWKRGLQNYHIVNSFLISVKNIEMFTCEERLCFESSNIMIPAWSRLVGQDIAKLKLWLSLS